MIMRSMGVALLVMGMAGGPVVACENLDADQVAFTLKSPLTGLQNRREFDVHTDFGVAFNVLNTSVSAVILCIDNQRVALRKGDVVVVEAAEFAAFRNGAYRALRPDVGFWNEAARLEDHLNLETKGTAQPDWKETPERLKAGPIGFPVLQRSSVKSSFGAKDVFQILLPVSGTARLAYRQKIESERSKSVPILVFDVSRSAMSFVEGLWKQIQQAKEFPEFAEAKITAVMLNGDGSHRIRSGITLGNLIQRLPTSSSGKDQRMPLNGASDALAQVLKPDLNRSQNAVWMFLGGDTSFGVPKENAGAKFIVFQLTPERDPELAQSAMSVDGAAYHPFSLDHSGLFYQLAKAVPEFTDGQSGSLGNEAIVSAQSEFGYLPFLPNVEGSNAGFAQTSDNEDWSAIPVWTLDNNTVFKSSSKRQ